MCCARFWRSASTLSATTSRLSRIQAVYNLVIAKGGLKIKEAKPGEISPYKFHVAGDATTPYSGPGITTRPSQDRPNHWISVFQQLDMTSLINSDFFNGAVDHPVIDKTGLKGVYNYSLDFETRPLSAAKAEGEAPEPDSPDIFTALEKQVGLKLEAGRGAVRHLVIDAIEKPQHGGLGSTYFPWSMR